MEETKKLSGKKKRILIIAGVVVLLLAAVIYSKYFLNFNGVSTELALRHTKEVTLPINFFVVRDEEYLDSPGSVQAIPLVSDGTRVAENDKIAVVCASETDAANYSEILEIEDDISYYKQLNSLTDISSINIESVDKQILSLFNEALDIADSGRLYDFDEGIKAFSDKKTRRDIAINGRMDFSQQLTQLNDRLTALKSGMSGVREIGAEKAGFYMGNTDGFENTLKYGDVLKLTPTDIENALASEEKQPGDNMGRLIKSHKWYLCTVVDNGTASELTKGGSYSLIVPEAGSVKLTFTLEAINQAEGKKSALIFSCLETGENIFNLRKGEAQLVRRTYTGYRIPQAAIRTEKKEDGTDEKFVYILNKTTVNRKEINIIYSDADYVLIGISTDKLNRKYVQVYDKIITAGKDLRDGKVIY
ncbi:MAG: hypothetical protein K5756_02405 [Clostridiales bacterium]|nr:hypothetical protein [Clostridiales bacterium]